MIAVMKDYHPEWDILVTTNRHLFLLSLLCERCGIQSNDNPAMAKHYLKDEYCEPI